MGSSVDHPDHYNVGDIETIDYLDSLGIAEDFCVGNAIKYLSRYKHKNGLQDLEKALWYIDWLTHNKSKSNKPTGYYDDFLDALNYGISSVQNR